MSEPIMTKPSPHFAYDVVLSLDASPRVRERLPAIGVCICGTPGVIVIERYVGVRAGMRVGLRAELLHQTLLVFRP